MKKNIKEIIKIFKTGKEKNINLEEKESKKTMILDFANCEIMFNLKVEPAKTYFLSSAEIKKIKEIFINKYNFNIF